MSSGRLLGYISRIKRLEDKVIVEFREEETGAYYFSIKDVPDFELFRNDVYLACATYDFCDGKPSTLTIDEKKYEVTEEKK